MTTTTHPNAYYTLVLRGGDKIDALPTPMLLSLGGGEAYEQEPADDRYPAVWRVRDDAYDAPGTVYSEVVAIVRKY